MTSTTYDLSEILPRAEAGLETERGKIGTLGLPYLIALASITGTGVACASELFCLTTALKAKFPVLSDGTDLGHEMMSLRWGILAALLLAHAILHDRPAGEARSLGRWVHPLRLVPMVVIIGGIGAFMFATTSQAAGGDDGQGGLAGYALGAACAGLFCVSFLASNALVGHLLTALRSILAGLAQRAKVAAIARELEATDRCRVEVAALRREITAKEQPDVLELKAASEAASICGGMASDAHDIHTSRKALSDDLRSSDTVKLPDTPLPVLDELQAYLKTLDVEFFLNLLKKKEA